MQFNELKSQNFLIATEKNIHRENINIYLKNKRLEHVKEVKYLGIYFDNTLNFHKHIEHTTEKLKKINFC